MTQAQAQDLPEQQYAIMPRLQWLAPLKVSADAGIGRAALLAAAAASRASHGRGAEERRGVAGGRAPGIRGPDDWRAQAAQRREEGALP
jgi:hypothetical protein